MQRIRATVDSGEKKRLLMEHNISMKSMDCPYTITFYGALFGDVRKNPSNQLFRNRSDLYCIACLYRAMCGSVWS